jgi:hypothetical protein
MRSIVLVSVVWLLAAFVSGAGGPVRAQDGNKTAPISGKWKGIWLETQGGRGTGTLEVSEEKGKVTCTWDEGGRRNKMDIGRRVADTLSLSMTIDGRPYVMRGLISDGGKRLTLDITFTDVVDGRLQKLTGVISLQKE